MTPLRECLECRARTSRTTRCPACEAKRQRERNQRRTQYAGAWRGTSKAARKRQPWCSLCGTTSDLTLDHEHNQVECRSCNSKHRREPRREQR